MYTKQQIMDVRRILTSALSQYFSVQFIAQLFNVTEKTIVNDRRYARQLRDLNDEKPTRA